MLTINRLGEHAGAEALGVDLREPIDAETRQRLNDALVEHVALVVRDQRFDAHQFLAAMRNFGEPVEQNFTAYRHESEPFVNRISNTFPAKSGERVYHSNYWHTDHTNRIEPPVPIVHGFGHGLSIDRLQFFPIVPQLRRKQMPSEQGNDVCLTRRALLRVEQGEAWFQLVYCQG